MVVVSVGVDDGGGGTKKTPGPHHYPPNTSRPDLPPHHHQPHTPGYDSDTGSDHSSSGRGSGGSDLGSEIDR